MPDLPDSDDLVLFLVLERVKTTSGVGGGTKTDLNKKSDIQVGFTEDEMLGRTDYKLPSQTKL
jgi:hypothetical protein